MIVVKLIFSQCLQAKMVERKTSPPDYLTESELISLMEKHGIGTDASIPVHINNICERNYVTIQAGRKLQPTTLGIILVHGYQKVVTLLCVKKISYLVFLCKFYYSNSFIALIFILDTANL